MLLDKDVASDIFNVTTSNNVVIVNEEMLLVGDVAEDNLNAHNVDTSNIVIANTADVVMEDGVQDVVQDDLFEDQEDVLEDLGQDDSLVDYELVVGLLKTKVSIIDYKVVRLLCNNLIYRHTPKIVLLVGICYSRQLI